MTQIDETRQKQQSSIDTSAHKNKEPIAPRWAALIGLLALGVIYAFLPGRLTLGPGWLPLVIVVALLLPFIISWILRRPLPHAVVRSVALTALGVVTLALIIGVILLVMTLSHTTEAQARGLLRDAALLWLSNILVFGLWYWEIDGGGPLKRHQAGHQAADFIFPQQANGMTTDWAPQFVDYLFVAFTAATALSPTDTFPLTRLAKALMMLEAVIALIIIVLLAARAVNIL